jgi:2-(1,2-epoxy-1,2-dihydrophenyl)acetyl-CoA isomerase
VIEQVLGCGRDGGDGVLERLSVVTGRGAEPADLADVLERGGSYVGVGDLLGVGLTECLDAAAHDIDVTPGWAGPLPPVGISTAYGRITLLTMTSATEFELDKDLGAVRLYRRGPAAKLELNRPERLNAWNEELGVALRDTVLELAADSSVRAVLVTGAGRAFSSGADLREAGESDSAGRPDVYTILTERYHPIITGIRSMPKPVIAAVNGAAAGIGLSLALSCDLVISAESAYFVLAFVNVGLVPDGGSSVLVPARIGFARAAELAMLGSRLSSGQALNWGLINRVWPDSELMPQAEDLTWQLANGPTGSYAGTKRQLNAWMYRGIEDQLELEARIQQERSGSADFAEGVAAFAAKRAPAFTGE